jgi:hypothetical protein
MKDLKEVMVSLDGGNYTEKAKGMPNKWHVKRHA